MGNRRIAVIVGSKSDFPQCNKGLALLDDYAKKDEIVEVMLFVASIHRNTREVLDIVKKLANLDVDVIITGAGWANHLSGTLDAFLRNDLKNNHVVVFGIAMEDKEDDKHTMAACLSISEVPGTQVIYNGDKKQFVGEAGFLEACKHAATRPLPVIKVPKPRETMHVMLSEYQFNKEEK